MQISPITSQEELFDSILYLCRLKISEGLITDNERTFLIDNLDDIDKETVWAGLDWRSIKHSGFTTGALGSAILSAFKDDNEICKSCIAKMNSVYEKLIYKDGHLHDGEIKIGRVVPLVLNITAFSMISDYYDGNMEAVNSKLTFLQRNQRRDGCFPYIASSALQKFWYAISPKITYNKVYRKYYGDCSISFYDVSHHVYILYLINKVKDKSNQKMIRKMSQKAINFLNNKSNIFDGEPGATYPRFCNFRDKTSYFLLQSVANEYQEEYSLFFEQIRNECSEQIKQIDDKVYFPLDKSFADAKNVIPAIWMSNSWKLFLNSEAGFAK